MQGPFRWRLLGDGSGHRLMNPPPPFIAAPGTHQYQTYLGVARRSIFLVSTQSARSVTLAKGLMEGHLKLCLSESLKAFCLWTKRQNLGT